MIGHTTDEIGGAVSPLLATGAGALQELPVLLDRLGVRKSLLVVGPGVGAAAERVQGLLGGRSTGTFTDAVAHGPSWETNLAVASAQEVHADSVIAIGGGSAAGYAKIIALALRLPRIAVPTSLSGAEMTSRYLVTTGKGKESGSSPRAAVWAVVRDPELLVDVPVRVLASSGMGAVGACLDVLGGRGSAGRDAAAEALRILWEVLPRLMGGPGDVHLRERALAGAALAGTALEAAGPGLALLVAEQLGATHRVDHGALMASLAPVVGADVDLVRELAGPGPVADSIRAFAGSLGLPIELGAACPATDADAVVASLVARPDLVGRADPNSLRMLLKEALR